MNSQQFARLKRILIGAKELPVSERRDFVVEACADDPELLAKAQSLLESDRALPEFLRTGGANDLLEGTETPLADWAGGETRPREIGGYRIRKILGEGGMGIVYEAEQRSPPPPRRAQSH